MNIVTVIITQARATYGKSRSPAANKICELKLIPPRFVTTYLKMSDTHPNLTGLSTDLRKTKNKHLYNTPQPHSRISRLVLIQKSKNKVRQPATKEAPVIMPPISTRPEHNIKSPAMNDKPQRTGGACIKFVSHSISLKRSFGSSPNEPRQAEYLQYKKTDVPDRQEYAKYKF
jgi:hypothetical protein